MGTRQLPHTVLSGRWSVLEGLQELQSSLAAGSEGSCLVMICRTSLLMSPGIVCGCTWGGRLWSSVLSAGTLNFPSTFVPLKVPHVCLCVEPCDAVFHSHSHRWKIGLIACKDQWTCVDEWR